MNYLLVKWIAYETWEINVKQGLVDLEVQLIWSNMVQVSIEFQHDLTTVTTNWSQLTPA